MVCQEKESPSFPLLAAEWLATLPKCSSFFLFLTDKMTFHFSSKNVGFTNKMENW